MERGSHVLALYNLQAYYNNEIQRGLSGTYIYDMRLILK